MPAARRARASFVASRLWRSLPRGRGDTRGCKTVQELLKCPPCPCLPSGATGAGKPQQALAFGQGWLAFGLENAGNLFGCSAGEHTGRHASTSDKMVGKKGSASLQPGLYQGPAALSRGQGVNPSPGGPPGGRYFRKCGATPTGTSPARRGGFGRKGCRRAPSWPGRRRSGSCGQAR